MTAPERIWIDSWGGNWSPRAGGTQEIEYIRADLIPAADAQAVREAALREAAAAVRRGAPGCMLAGDVDELEAYVLALLPKGGA